uniref:Uncharacterized protein n=1 Tax=Ditylenchus dipsaci TaxID=166011 RepID=A0A915DHJ8_9BILA
MVNLAKLGGSMHQICMSHLGSTIAKRSTKPYKNSCLSEEEKNACLEVSSGLCCLEKLVSNVRTLSVLPTNITSCAYGMGGQTSEAPSERAFKELRCVVGKFLRKQNGSKKVADVIRLRNLYMKEIT